MKAKWNGRFFEQTAEPGEYLNAADCQRNWIAEQEKDVFRRKHLAKYADGRERRELEVAANEIDSRIDVSRRNLIHLEGKTSARGIESRLVDTPSVELHRERLAYLERVQSSMNSLSGYAAVFYNSNDDGTEYRMSSHLIERIERGAFSETLAKRHDIKALWSHDAASPLGSTAAGTLKLSEDSKGLRFELQPDKQTTLGTNCFHAVRGGYVRGMSFGFRVISQKMSRELGQDIRTITRLHLSEISPCCWGAYNAAFIQ
jgi:HK97 family phage prohead protease